MGDKGSPPHKVWRRFARKDGKIDIEALKAEYLNGPDFSFVSFLDRAGYNPKPNWNNLRKNGLEVTAWKREWIKLKAADQDEELVEQSLDIRKAVALSRMHYVKDWGKRASYMKALLDGILQAHGDALMRDRQNTLAIQAKHRQAEFKLDGQELATLSTAAQKIQDIDLKSILLVNSPSAIEQKADEHEEEAPEFQITTMEGAGLTAKESVKLLSEYFDQVEKPKELPPPPEVKNEPQDNG